MDGNLLSVSFLASLRCLGTWPGWEQKVWQSYIHDGTVFLSLVHNLVILGQKVIEQDAARMVQRETRRQLPIHGS